MMTGASPVLVPREDPVGKILFAVVAITFGLAFFVALMTLAAAVLRGQTGRCRAILAETPYRALIVGAAGYAILGALAWYFFSFAFIRRLLETEIVPSMLGGGIAVAAVLLIVTLAGAPGTFVAVGDRLERLHGRPMSGLARVALGTLVAVLAAWFPVLGWCLVVPLLLLASFGSAVTAMLPVRWARRQPRAETVLVAAEEDEVSAA
jgi:hypothetical protein